MPLLNNKVSQNGLEELRKHYILQAVRVMWTCLWSSSDGISGHHKNRKN